MIFDVSVGRKAFWKKDAGGRALRASSIGLVAALALIGCASRELHSGDETHFLDCHVDADCSDSGVYRCEKGVCVAAAEQPPRSSDAGKGTAALPSATSMPSSMPGDVGGSDPRSDAGPSMTGHGNPDGHITDAGSTPSTDAEIAPTRSDAANSMGQVLAEVGALTSATAMDDTALYFVTGLGGSVPPEAVWSVPKNGSAPAKPLWGTTAFVEGLAVDDRFIYFTDLVDGTINRLPKSGGPSEIIAMGQTRPWGIAVDDVAVYWANQGTNQAGVPGNAGASVMKLSKEGGDPVALASNEQMCTSILLDRAGGIVWQNGPNGATNGSLRRLELPSGSATLLAAGLDSVSAPAVAGERVFWSNPSGLGTDATLSSAPLAGGATTTTLTLGSGNGATAVPVAADSDAVYIAAAEGGLNDGSIRKLSLSNGSVALISAAAPEMPGLVVRNQIVSLLLDAENLYVFEYWADADGAHGRVRSVPK